LIRLFFSFGANDLAMKSETILVYEPKEHNRHEKISETWSPSIARRSVLWKKKKSRYRCGKQEYIVGRSPPNE